MHLPCQEPSDMVSSERKCKLPFRQEFTVALKTESLFHCYIKSDWWVQGSGRGLRTAQARLRAGVVEEGSARCNEWHLVHCLMPAGTCTVAKSDLCSDAQLHAPAAMQKRPALFWDITQRIEVNLVDVSGQLIGPIFKDLSVPSSRIPEDGNHSLSNVCK